MGYDLRITRSSDWTRNQGRMIDGSEWLALVSEDPELTPDPTHGPYAVHWGSTWFDWFEGNVFTTDPDRATVAKMLKLAERVAGAVQGDDGEFYETVQQWTTREARAGSGPGEPGSA